MYCFVGYYAFTVTTQQHRQMHYVFRLSRLSGQILLPQYVANGLNSFYNKTDWEYLLAPTDDLIRFWRSKVKVTSGHQGQIL